MAIDSRKLYEHVGTQVREARRLRNITQDDLAQRVGVKRTSITNLEKGLQNAPLTVLYSICDELKIEISDILPAVQEVSPTTNKRISVHELFTSVNGEVEEIDEETAALILKLSKKGKQRK